MGACHRTYNTTYHQEHIWEDIEDSCSLLGPTGCVSFGTLVLSENCPFWHVPTVELWRLCDEVKGCIVQVSVLYYITLHTIFLNIEY